MSPPIFSSVNDSMFFVFSVYVSLQKTEIQAYFLHYSITSWSLGVAKFKKCGKKMAVSRELRRCWFAEVWQEISTLRRPFGLKRNLL